MLEAFSKSSDFDRSMHIFFSEWNEEVYGDIAYQWPIDSLISSYSRSQELPI